MSRTTYITIGALAVLILAGGWYFFTRSTPSTGTGSGTSGFGIGDTRGVTIPESGNSNGQTVISTPEDNGNIFKISDGPITTATLVQTKLPTTTLARFVLQENGHVADLILDSAGQVPRAVSNTTIPGTARGLWLENGNAVLLQYFDSGITKSVFLGFSSNGTSTQVRPARIQFLPDNIIDIAGSPDGKNVVYLLKSGNGSDGYIARDDGVGSKKLFSTPLSQVLISWPAQNTLLLQTKSSTASEGAAFSISTQSGAITPLVYAPGLTALGDKTMSKIVYQTSTGGAASYVHDIKTGVDTRLVFDPFPEKCAWSPASAATLFCASPVEGQISQYLDLWHQGAASAADAILKFNFADGGSSIVGIPGTNGGDASDIAEIAISPDEKYLIFIKKGDRSLWGVRLTE